MTDANIHNEPFKPLLSGYVTEHEVSVQRGKTKRTLRAERQRGDGPPFVKDGKTVLYPIDGFRAWLKAIERKPVRGPSVKAS